MSDGVGPASAVPPGSGPLAERARIVAIDVVRGFALLGIPLMNVTAWAMPESAYANPQVGAGGWLDRLIFNVEYVFVNQKFMGLFSLLFGAGILLLTERLDASGRSTLPVYLRRNLWLFVFGVLHLTFIWAGDVLTLYAIAGVLLYPCRRLPTRWLVGIAVAVLLVPVMLAVPAQTWVAGTDIAAAERYWQPSPAELADEVAVFAEGSWSEQVEWRLASDAPSDPVTDGLDLLFLVDAFCRALGMMLLGMAGYRIGLVTGRAPTAVLRRFAVWGLGVGLSLAAFGLWWNTSLDWPGAFSLTVGRIPNSLATPMVVLGYAAVVALWSRTDVAQGLQARLAATGRMALTNYIGQSIIGTAVFYAWGLGLFGQVGRAGQLLVLLAIWATMLTVSPWWLARFRFGPLEWLWRTLTYWRWQPIRRHPSSRRR